MKVIMDVMMNKKILMIEESQMLKSQSWAENYSMIEFILFYLAYLSVFLQICFSKLFVCLKNRFLLNLDTFLSCFTISCIYLMQAAILCTNCGH